MNKRNCLFSILAVLLLSFSLALTGCGKKQAPEEAAERYGVADLETLVKAHPKYSEYFKEETEYKYLLEQYESERNKLVDLSTQKRRINAAMNDESTRMAAEKELQTKVAAKQDELNSHLNFLYNQIQKKHSQSSGDVVFQPLTPEQQLKMANLQLKLTVVGVSGEEKEQTKKELHDLLDAQITKKSDESGWSKEEIDQMTTARDKAAQELNEYAAQTAEEIKIRLDNSGQGDSSEPDGSIVPDDWNEAWQKRIKDKQDAMADLKKQIMDDIRIQAAYVGDSKNLTMIFCKYRVNINAEDVTGDIVSRLVNTDQSN